MKRNKYNNKKCYWDGYKFDSVKERDYYINLKHQSSKLHGFTLVVKPIFELIPKFKWENRGIRRATIQPDFLLIHPVQLDGTWIYEVQDVKGFDKKSQKFRTTEKFDLQWKLLKFYAYTGELCTYFIDDQEIFVNRLARWRFNLV